MADSYKSLPVGIELHQYVVEHGTPPDAIQQELIEETAKLGGISLMQIAPEQGAFMTLLARAIGARHAIEVGTFTGYSALCLARGLPADGRVIACDVSRDWTSIARRYWEKAGVAEKIDLRIGPAGETLRALPAEPVFDLAFIDADKEGYLDYYEQILARLRRGGLILVDNVLWMGRVVKPSADPETTAIRAFNDAVARDPRVDCTMLAIADGLTILRKR